MAFLRIFLHYTLSKPEGASWEAYIRWLFAMWRYRRIIMNVHCPERTPDGIFTAILLNFRRPQNIEILARMLLQVPLIKRVIISNNNPKSNLSRFLRFSHPRLTVLQQPGQRPCAYRYFIARETQGEYFLCIDDDLFLLSSQVQKMCEETLKNPSVPHGMFGQELLKDGTFRYGISRREGRIDILNRIYAFSSPLLVRWHLLLEATGLSHDVEAMRMGWWDDMLLAFSGDSLPVSHDVGPYLDCCTQGEAGIATWREEEFFPSRDRLYKKLRTLRSITDGSIFS
ncbi:glycosyltransferase family 2 protein [Candidatus Peribacteria bacterium]|nr:glycosyltransferase family 2 protein [Candidatus Peribacteria bacterium]